MPDRVFAKSPKRAAYFVLFLALVILTEGIWIFNLNGRVSDAEAIRRAETRASVERRKLGCQFVSSLIDVSIVIPLKNIQDLLDGTTLTPKERVDRLEAKGRYMSALHRMQFALEGCER